MGGSFHLSGLYLSDRCDGQYLQWHVPGLDRALFCWISRGDRDYGWDRDVNIYAKNKTQLPQKKPFNLRYCLGIIFAHHVSDGNHNRLPNRKSAHSIRNLHHPGTGCPGNRHHGSAAYSRWCAALEEKGWGYLLTIFLAFAAGVTFTALSVAQILNFYSYQIGGIAEVIQMVVFAVIATGFSLAAFQHIED